MANNKRESREELSEWLKSFQRKETLSSEKENPSATLAEAGTSSLHDVLDRSETKAPKPAGTLESPENVEIVESGTTQPLYKVKLPDLTERERDLMNEVKEQAIDEIGIDPDAITDPKKREEVFIKEVKKMLMEESRGMNLSPKRSDELTRIIVRDMIGFGSLDILLGDPLLEDILVVGIEEPVYIFHRDHGMCKTNIYFDDEEQIIHYIEKMGRLVGRRIDQQNPLLDARLPDGSRINATIPPISLSGPTISIRKFKRNPLTYVFSYS